MSELTTKSGYDGNGQQCKPYRMVTVVNTITLTPVASVRLFRQLDSIRVLPFAFVLLAKNFFEPMCLTLSDSLIHKCRIVEDDKCLTAIVAAKSTHLL